jgi:hypothetical protein
MSARRSAFPVAGSADDGVTDKAAKNQKTSATPERTARLPNNLEASRSIDHRRPGGRSAKSITQYF